MNIVEDTDSIGSSAFNFNLRKIRRFCHEDSSDVRFPGGGFAAGFSGFRGVGPQTAENIVTYREQNGGFENPEDLMKVNGIGPKIFENNKEDILVAD